MKKIATIISYMFSYKFGFIPFSFFLETINKNQIFTNLMV